MAFCLTPDPRITVDGKLILESFVHVLKRGTESRLAILEKHGILPEAGKQYPLQTLLDAVREIAEEIGHITLFAMGRDSVNRANLPIGLTIQQGLEQSFQYLNLHHFLDGQPLWDAQTKTCRPGVGGPHLTFLDAQERKAIVVANSVYPHSVSEGFLWGLLEHCTDRDPNRIQVKEDINQERQSQGGNNTTFLLSW